LPPLLRWLVPSRLLVFGSRRSQPDSRSRLAAAFTNLASEASHRFIGSAPHHASAHSGISAAHPRSEFVERPAAESLEEASWVDPVDTSSEQRGLRTTVG